MENKNINKDWKEIIDKFSNYEGKIVDFCKENNITPQQLYRRRKNLNKIQPKIFQAVEIQKALEITNQSKNGEIRIEIGTAKIFIPSNDKDTLIYVLKEFANIC